MASQRVGEGEGNFGGIPAEPPSGAAVVVNGEGEWVSVEVLPVVGVGGETGGRWRGEGEEGHVGEKRVSSAVEGVAGKDFDCNG